MVEKRKYRSHVAPPIIYKRSNNSTHFFERNEMMRLTKFVKSCDFHCTFCFKTFRSAQAMGGHQNAHRDERLEEKRLFVKDPIGYRKRAFLRAMKAMEDAESSKMVNHELSIINGVRIPMSGDFVEFNAGDIDINGENRKIFLPVKELNLAENVGVYAEGGKGKAFMEFDCGVYGMNSENLDLTLRL